MSAAINDAPTDDLDIEDEVFSPERMRAYEAAQLARGHAPLPGLRPAPRDRRAGRSLGVARRRASGPRSATSTTPRSWPATAATGSALLLKTEMNLWLREVQPQLVSIDTWNAESNDHMIGVNDAIGYRIMGRELEFQKSL